MCNFSSVILQSTDGAMVRLSNSVAFFFALLFYFVNTKQVGIGIVSHYLCFFSILSFHTGQLKFSFTFFTVEFLITSVKHDHTVYYIKKWGRGTNEWIPILIGYDRVTTLIIIQINWCWLLFDAWLFPLFIETVQAIKNIN